MGQFIAIEGYQFHYVTLGNPSLPPMIFLHGFLGESSDFFNIMSSLSEEYYCLAVDLPGHGKTQVVGADSYYGMAETAKGVVQFLQTLVQQPCTLIGYSMGGRLSLYLALHFPQCFHRIILESASPGLKTVQERQLRQQEEDRLIRQLKEGNFESFLAQWYDQPLFRYLKEHSQFSEILARRLRNNPLELAKSLQFIGTGHQPSLWPKLSQNQLPILLLVGELDQKFVSINHEMAQQCASVELSIIKGCGHVIHLEDPSCFVTQVRNFLKRGEIESL